VKTPVNRFKLVLKEGRVRIGFWLALTDSYSAEICAGAGFDWLLIDGEHSPHTLVTIVGQLQAISGYPECDAVVRVPWADQVTIKQYLDLGVQTVLVPMVENAEQAAEVVRACYYPPAGIRGVGGARAARWGRYRNYVTESNEQMCVLVQVESKRGLDNLEQIAAVEGVNGVFIGTADLAASLGYPGDAANAVVQDATLDAFRKVLSIGKAPGAMARDEALIRRYLDNGALFVAVGLDAHLLAAQTTALAARFRGAR